MHQEAKSAQPLNEVRVTKALPEYYIKYSQNENATSDYFNRLSSILSFEPSKSKVISLYKIKEAFYVSKLNIFVNFYLKFTKPICHQFPSDSDNSVDRLV